MKKTILSVAVLLAIAFGGCFAVSEGFAPKIAEDNQVVCNMYSLIVEKNSSGYRLTLTANDASTGTVLFDSKGAMVSAMNVQPLKADTLAPQVLNRVHTRDDMLNVFGEPMVDIGSGLYIPAYITDDGRILSFAFCADEITKYTIQSITKM